MNDVQVVGADAAARDLHQWADKVGPAVDKAALGLAGQAAGRVRGAVPVLTGRLAGSVDVLADNEGVQVGMGAGVPYAGWIEFGGTHGRPYVAQGRYLWPTVSEYEDDYVELAEQTITDTAERFPWSTP